MLSPRKGCSENVVINFSAKVIVFVEKVQNFCVYLPFSPISVMHFRFNSAV